MVNRQIFVYCFCGFLFLPVVVAAETIDDLFDQEKSKGELADDKSKKDQSKSAETADPPASQRRPTQFQWNDSGGRSYSLDMMAAVDTVLEHDKNRPHSTENKYSIRSAEIGLYSAIDHLAEGIVTFAAHDEDGELTAELHEAYFQMPGTVIPRTTLRLGQMFVDAGRLNTIHLHDRPFITTPVVHEKLLDKEGISDAGVEAAILMPWSFWQELTFGAFNGRYFGHSHRHSSDDHGHSHADHDHDNINEEADDEFMHVHQDQIYDEHLHSPGSLKNNPLFTARLKQFVGFGDHWGSQFGFSYLRWHPEKISTKVSHQYGVDFLIKYQKGKLTSFQWLTEVWYREIRMKNQRKLDPPADPVTTYAGGYTFIEWQPFEQWSFGARYDYFKIPTLVEMNLNTGEDEYRKNGLEEVSMIVTFRPSEFSFFRGQASTRVDFETGIRTWQYYLQATFILGKHPAHLY